MLQRRAPEEDLRRGVEAIGDVSFDVAAGEFVCIVGPSGCGKTTLLKCIGGPARADRGEVRARGRAASTGRPSTMALVFQEYSRSLFPWMTVRQNVAFPLRRKKLARPRRRDWSRRRVGVGRPRATRSTATRGSSPAACSSAWRSRARSPTSRGSC